VRVFLAGASGVIGIRLLPLLVGQGHVVAAMTRSAGKAEHLRALGGEPVVVDVFDGERLTEAVTRFQTEAVMHQLTDLPDRLEELDAHAAANDRIRSEGTRNLIAAARAAGADHFVAQSIAWRTGTSRDEIVDLHERLVLEIGGVVARYGRLYGPGTYYEDTHPPHPRIQIDDATRATPPLLEARAGIVTLAEPEAPGG
jgi:UDP-glucose 4-epimerase